MSIVLERVEEAKNKIPAEILEELSNKPLSRVMRRQTWPDHERAEFSDFEQALVKGTISREGYAELLVQTYFIYIALEEKAVELQGDPVAGPVLFPELLRKDFIEADLEFYLGPEWRDQIKPMEVTEEYVDRIRSSSPEQFVAHHYTRYLADLSGGLMIAASLKNAWNLDRDGIRYYEFPGIPDANEWKKEYRKTLDELPVDPEMKRRIIEEVLIAYEFNIELANQLGDRFLAPSS